MFRSLPEIEKRTRELMRDAVAKNEKTPLPDLIREVTNVVDGFSPEAKSQFFAVIDKVPMAYQKTNAIFATPEKKTPGAGGVFSIFVSDLCKGCAACVTACGDHQALRMVQETEEVNAEHETGTAFLDLLPDTSQKYLGLYNDDAAAGFEDRHAAQHADGAPQLRRARVGRRRLRGLRREEHPQGHHVGHRSLHAAALPREGAIGSARRPISSSAKASRSWRRSKARSPEEYELFTPGRRPPADGTRRRGRQGHARRASPRTAPISDKDIVGAITAVMRQEAFNHKNLQAIDGRLANGMSVMAMAAHTGCNTVYGSTPSNNPHPYPWMNSLFQDGITVGWLLGESFIVDHGRRSVVPERLADALLHRETGRDQPARVLRVRPLQRRRDDRPGDSGAAEGLGRRRRRRHGRHRLSEHVEGDSPEPPEREGA